MVKGYIGNKGQSPITIVFYVLVFVIVWALFLGDFVGDSVEGAVTNNNLTGIEAFGFMIIPLIILSALLIYIVASLIFGGGG